MISYFRSSCAHTFSKSDLKLSGSSRLWRRENIWDMGLLTCHKEDKNQFLVVFPNMIILSSYMYAQWLQKKASKTTCDNFVTRCIHPDLLDLYSGWCVYLRPCKTRIPEHLQGVAKKVRERALSPILMSWICKPKMHFIPTLHLFITIILVTQKDVHVQTFSFWK